MAEKKMPITVGADIVPSLKTVEDVMRSYRVLLQEMTKTIIKYGNSLSQETEASLRCFGDALNDAFDTADSKGMAFALGKMKGALDISSAIIDSIEKTRVEQSRLNDENLMNILRALFINGGSLTHAELAKNVSKSASALSMAFKRHPYWWDYVDNVENPSNPKSVLVVLNMKGAAALNGLGMKTDIVIKWARPVQTKNERRLIWQMYRR